MSTEDEEAPLSPEEEAVLKQELAAALESYRGLAPPELLEAMRRIAEGAGRTHPVARRLLKAAASRPTPQRSADLPAGSSAASADEAGEKERR